MSSQGTRVWVGPWLLELGEKKSKKVLVEFFGRDASEADWKFRTPKSIVNL